MIENEDACSLAREASIAWAQNMLSFDNWVMVATETTGLHSSAEIVELSMLNHHGETLIETLLRPQGSIQADAVAVHGITSAMVQNSPSFPKIAPVIFGLLEQRRIIGYNVAFEMRMLLQCSKRHDLELNTSYTECLMTAYAQYWGEHQANGKAFRRQTLKKACEQQNINWHIHRDGPKCRAEFALLTAMVTPSSNLSGKTASKEAFAQVV